MSLTATTANACLAVAGRRAAARFDRALHDPAAAQAEVLRRLVTRNRDTAFGSAHGFDGIRTLADYRRRVPLRAFEELRPWLGAVEDGRPGVLTAERVGWLEPSGGSAGPSKLVPYTGGLRAELAAATLPWLLDLQRTRPRLRTGSAYWAISPPVHGTARTPGGVPIGAADDAEYFPRPLRGILRRGQAVPGSVTAGGDLRACRRATLRALLAAEDLAFLSVWSPTFLTRLTEVLDEDWAVLRTSRPGLPATAPSDLGALWPRLDLISCWTDAAAARALPALRRRFPGVAIQGKGLLATEGVVTIPLHDAAAPVAAVRSHLLEFLADGRPHAVDELDAGGVYEVVLSTSGGLYRYRLGDLVRVEGRLRATPLLRFLGRADGRVDLAGEKLSPAFVEGALTAAAARSGVVPRFAVLHPARDRRGYLLTVELDASHADAHADAHAADALAAALERELRASHHYRLARDLGQLAAVAARAAPHAERAWEAAALARGQRAGAIKPPVLHPHPIDEELPCAPRP